MKYISIIEEYFSGKLTGKALEDFIAEINSNPDLRDEFEIYKEAHDFAISQENNLIKDISKLRDFEFEPGALTDIRKYSGKSPSNDDENQLSDILQAVNINYKEGERKKCKCSIWIKAAAIFAIITVLGITGILICPNLYKQDELFKKYYSPYEHSFHTRSISNSYDRLFIEGTIFYDNGKYDLAIALFEKIPDCLRYSDELNIVEGICYIELEGYHKAIEKFEKNSENSLLYDSSLWYLGLCYLKLSDNNNARVVFQKLKSFEGSYQKKSIKIMKYLHR